MSDTPGTTPDLVRSLTGSAEEPALTLERRFRTDPADLWEAITDPDRLARWFGEIVTLPRAPGDPLVVRLGEEDGAGLAEGTLTACEPPGRLGYDWAFGGTRSRVRVDLVPGGEGTTLLRLHHTRLAPGHLVGYGGGWEEGLTVLAAQLAGGSAGAVPPDPERRRAEERGQDAWRELDRHPLRLERTLPADVGTVWAAFTTEAGLRRWWWNHWSDVEFAVDLRPGGRYRITAPGPGIGVEGTFLAVEPTGHLAYSWEWVDAEGRSRHEAVDLRFSPTEDGGTRLDLRHTGPWADDAPARSYREGWEFTLGALDTLLRG